MKYYSYPLPLLVIMLILLARCSSPENEPNQQQQILSKNENLLNETNRPQEASLSRTPHPQSLNAKELDFKLPKYAEHNIEFNQQLTYFCFKHSGERKRFKDTGDCDKKIREILSECEKSTEKKDQRNLNLMNCVKSKLSLK